MNAATYKPGLRSPFGFQMLKQGVLNGASGDILMFMDVPLAGINKHDNKKGHQPVLREAEGHLVIYPTCIASLKQDDPEDGSQAPETATRHYSYINDP